MGEWRARAPKSRQSGLVCCRSLLRNMGPPPVPYGTVDPTAYTQGRSAARQFALDHEFEEVSRSVRPRARFSRVVKPGEEKRTVTDSLTGPERTSWKVVRRRRENVRVV